MNTIFRKILIVVILIISVLIVKFFIPRIRSLINLVNFVVNNKILVRALIRGYLVLINLSLIVYKSLPYFPWLTLTSRNVSIIENTFEPNSQLSYPFIDDVLKNLFVRNNPVPKYSNGNLLFLYFAMFFVHNFLSIDSNDLIDRRNNTSISSYLYPQYQEILQIYKNDLGFRRISGSYQDTDYLDLDIMKMNPLKIKDINNSTSLKNITTIINGNIYEIFGANRVNGLTDEEYSNLYASTRLRANTQIGFYFFDIIFLRFHNFVVQILHRKFPEIDTQLYYDLAQNVVTALVWFIIVNDYIRNGFLKSGDSINLRFVPKNLREILDNFVNPDIDEIVESQNMDIQRYTSNEFNILNYRYHTICPNVIPLGKDSNVLQEDLLRYNNIQEVLNTPPNQVIEAWQKQNIYESTFNNSDDVMLNAIKGDILLARKLNFGSVNDYRRAFNMTPYESINELARNDPIITEKLTNLYGNIENVEAYVGTIGETSNPKNGRPFNIDSILIKNLFNTAVISASATLFINLNLCHKNLLIEVLSSLGITEDDLNNNNFNLFGRLSNEMIGTNFESESIFNL